MTVRSLMFLTAAGFLSAQAPSYRIFSACDEFSEVRAEITTATPVRIQFSIAGGSTCYLVTAIIDGKELRGYVLDPTLDAVAAFEMARAKDERESFDRRQAAVTPPAKTPDAPPASTRGHQRASIAAVAGSS